MIREPESMSPESRNSVFSDEQARLADKKPFLYKRSRILQAIRRFFIERGYLEVETPYIIPAPAPEVHIDAMSAGDLFLHTSPELCMKRLMAAGYHKIFQISKCFREGERGDLHLPEFTMLEWYRAGIDYGSLMEECESMILSVVKDVATGESNDYASANMNFESPWERLSVEDAFDLYASITPEMAVKKGLFDEIMVQEVEPHLGVTRPVFLYDYPSSLASLARLRHDDHMVAERFELYMGGMELANGFSELTEENEQRARFEEVLAKRIELGKKATPMPEKFLKALQHMPESAGIALGIDRLVMIFTGTHKIDDVVSFTQDDI